MGRLFGTDGIRGRANHYPLTAEIALKTGRAVASYFCTDNKDTIIISRDTRISGDVFEAALAAGITSMGRHVQLTGVIPTPGAAYCVAQSSAAACIMISASHNPYYDNGIKLFNQHGYKLSDDDETNLEALILMDDQSALSRDVINTGRVTTVSDAAEAYTSFLARTTTTRFDSIRAVIDCSNGAASPFARSLFERLGVDCEILFNSPDGININDGCGSEHPDVLAKQVVASKADIGLAFDGDGDRLIAVDHQGEILTGDQVIAICAAHAQSKGALTNNCVVTTIMSNMGLKVTLGKLGITHVMADVGDRKVMHEMIKNGAVIGGEDSGHMIFLNHHTTGDGMLSAIKLLEVMKETGKGLSELAGIMPVFPQKLINVDVAHKDDITGIKSIMSIIDQVENKLGETGRVLVRYSGTQPVCRVMVEGPDAQATKQYCREIADVIQVALN